MSEQSDGTQTPDDVEAHRKAMARDDVDNDGRPAEERLPHQRGEDGDDDVQAHGGRRCC